MDIISEMDELRKPSENSKTNNKISSQSCLSIDEDDKIMDTFTKNQNNRESSVSSIGNSTNRKSIVAGKVKSKKVKVVVESKKEINMVGYQDSKENSAEEIDYIQNGNSYSSLSKLRERDDRSAENLNKKSMDLYSSFVSVSPDISSPQDKNGKYTTKMASNVRRIINLRKLTNINTSATEAKKNKDVIYNSGSLVQKSPNPIKSQRGTSKNRIQQLSLTERDKNKRPNSKEMLELKNHIIDLRNRSRSLERSNDSKGNSHNKTGRSKAKDSYVEYSKLPLSLKKELVMFMVKNGVDFEKDYTASNQQTLVAKLEIVGQKGHKAKIALTQADINQLCRKSSSIEGKGHHKCKEEEWLIKRNMMNCCEKTK